MWHVCGRIDMYTEFWWVNFKASDDSEDLDIGKVRPTTPVHDTEGRRRLRDKPLAILATDGGELSAPRLGRVIPGKTQYPLYNTFGGPRGRSGRARETSPHPHSFQPIASTYYAIPAALSIDGRIILKQMLTEKYGKAYNELMWPRLETYGELF
jgi:hypothetical protein